MTKSLPEQIVDKITQIAELYYRFVLVVAPSGSGKTEALQEVAKSKGYRYININLELSRLLLELTQKQRSLKIPRILDDIVSSNEDRVVLLDNIEILFDVSLKQAPLRLIQGLSRNKTLVVAWNGSMANGQLIYADPDHPEYRRYSAADVVTITPELPL